MPRTIARGTFVPNVVPMKTSSFFKKSIASKAKPAVRYGGYKTNPNMGKGELMSIDTGIGSICPNVPIVQLCNGIAQGDDINNRKGRKITMKSVHLKGSLFTSLTAVTLQNVSRVALVYDKACNGVALTAAEVYVITTNGNGIRLLDNRDRFTVIFDIAHASSAGSSMVASIDKFKKINLDTIYKGTTNAVASISTGSLYLIMWGDNLANTPDIGHELRAQLRIRYADA